MKKIISLILIISVLLSLPTLSYAYDYSLTDKIGIEVRVLTNEEYLFLKEISNDFIMQPYGGSPPSNKWDLSQGNYSGTFGFNSFTYTNNKFKSHDGDFYMLIDSSADISNPSDYSIEISLMKDVLFSHVVAASAEIPIGVPYIVTFTGYDIVNYYVKFSHPAGQSGFYVEGEFTISDTNEF